MHFPKRPHSDHVLFISTVRSILFASDIFAGSAQGWVVFNKSSQRIWKTLEDVGRRGWKTWVVSRKRLEDVTFFLKRRKASFLFFKFEIHVFQAILRGFPTSSSNVFQRLPTSSMCVATTLGDCPKPISMLGAVWAMFGRSAASNPPCGSLL